MSAASTARRRSTTSSLSVIVVVLTAVLSWLAVTPRPRAGTPMSGSDGIVLV